MAPADAQMNEIWFFFPPCLIFPQPLLIQKWGSWPGVVFDRQSLRGDQRWLGHRNQIWSTDHRLLDRIHLSLFVFHRTGRILSQPQPLLSLKWMLGSLCSLIFCPVHKIGHSLPFFLWHIGSTLTIGRKDLNGMNHDITKGWMVWVTLFMVTLGLELWWHFFTAKSFSERLHKLGMEL